MTRAAKRPYDRRMLRALALSLCLTLSIVAAAAETRFLSGLNDVPLMDGLVELPDRQTLFDAPGGRIVELYAEGRQPPAQVLAFYAQSLPQLGWVPVPVPAGDALTLTRDGESLTISAKVGAATLVRFSLHPR